MDGLGRCGAFVRAPPHDVAHPVGAFIQFTEPSIGAQVESVLNTQDIEGGLVGDQ
jgi:hypothetical protein